MHISSGVCVWFYYVCVWVGSARKVNLYQCVSLSIVCRKLFPRIVVHERHLQAGKHVHDKAHKLCNAVTFQFAFKLVLLHILTSLQNMCYTCACSLFAYGATDYVNIVTTKRGNIHIYTEGRIRAK